MQEFEMFIDGLADRVLQDINDYFRLAVLREFPDLDFEALPGDLMGWLIVMPPQRTYSVGLVQAHCVKIQDELFWKKDVLIRFGILRDGDELEEVE